MNWLVFIPFGTNEHSSALENLCIVYKLTQFDTLADKVVVALKVISHSALDKVSLATGVGSFLAYLLPRARSLVLRDSRLIVADLLQVSALVKEIFVVQLGCSWLGSLTSDRLEWVNSRYVRRMDGLVQRALSIIRICGTEEVEENNVR